jgi:hypothetical protein
LQVIGFFAEHPPDFTGLYRLLKRMERESLLMGTNGNPTGPLNANT